MHECHSVGTCQINKFNQNDLRTNHITQSDSSAITCSSKLF